MFSASGVLVCLILFCSAVFAHEAWKIKIIFSAVLQCTQLTPQSPGFCWNKNVKALKAFITLKRHKEINIIKRIIIKWSKEGWLFVPKNVAYIR